LSINAFSRSDEHAKRIMGNGVIIPYYELENPWRWYYRV
jgi:hypothetical protein